MKLFLCFFKMKKLAQISAVPPHLVPSRTTPYVAMIFSLTLHRRAEKIIRVLLEDIYSPPFANIISVNGGF
jgi:hypothetical protein